MSFGFAGLAIEETYCKSVSVEYHAMVVKHGLYERMKLKDK